MRLVFLHKILFSDILWFSVAGPQVPESGLSCGDSYGVWFPCGAGFPFARGVFNWDGVFLWIGFSFGDFLMGVSFSYHGLFLHGGAFQRRFCMECLPVLRVIIEFIIQLSYTVRIPIF